MSRRILCLAATTLLLPGCVFLVNQPLSDPDKAESDKRLVGKWELVSASQVSVVGENTPGSRLFEQGRVQGEKKLCAIDLPAVKGNPKGLMHCRDAEHDFWFFITTIGKHTYWTVYLDAKGGCADFSQEGAFAKWNKGDLRLYEILLAVPDGDRLTLHQGGIESVKKVMADELIPAGKMGKDLESFEYFKTPPGWLAKYLEKHGPDALYNYGASVTWMRPEAVEKEQKAKAEADQKEREQAARKAEQQKREQRAASYLRSAKLRVDRGMIEDAKQRLQEIVEKFPKTEAEKEAKQLLEKLNK